MDKPSIAAYIAAEDPLSVESLHFLAGYREEDLRIDYKEAFNFRDEREWLEITKDVMAFANTFGGYLLFGVRDGSYELVGLDGDTSKILTDVNNFQQKINRFVDPPVLHLRAKAFSYCGHDLVTMFIPRLEGRTHVVSKDGRFKYPSGEEKLVLHKGMIYVRRSGGNHLADSRDVDDLVARRFEEFKNSLLSKISRVVEAPPQSEIFVLSSDPTDKTGKRFIIDDGPESIAVKGMSFTVAPQTPEQEIAGWTSILQRTPDELPPRSILWQWYAQRDAICSAPQHKLALARFSLLSELPVFFWLRGAVAPDIRPIISDALTRACAGRIDGILRVAAFLGRKFYESLVRKVKDPKRHLTRETRNYPDLGPRSLFRDSLIQQIRNVKCQGSESECQKYIKAELDAISAQVDGKSLHEPDGMNIWLARVYDCYLYALDNKYSKSSEEKTEALPTSASSPTS